MQGLQGQARGILLAAQVACHATVQPYTQLGQVLTQRVALAHATGERTS